MGVRLNKVLLQAHCIISGVGFNLCFFPMHYFGLCGLPRRVCVYEANYRWINSLCTMGSLISAVSGCFFIFILWESLAQQNCVLGYYGSGAYITNLVVGPVPYHRSFFSFGYKVHYERVVY